MAQALPRAPPGADVLMIVHGARLTPGKAARWQTPARAHQFMCAPPCPVPGLVWTKTSHSFPPLRRRGKRLPTTPVRSPTPSATAELSGKGGSPARLHFPAPTAAGHVTRVANGVWRKGGTHPPHQLGPVTGRVHRWLGAETRAHAWSQEPEKTPEYTAQVSPACT